MLSKIFSIHKEIKISVPSGGIVIRFIVSTLLGFCVYQARGVEAYEYEIKATYIYNFAKFTDWPNGSDPVILCVFGKEILRNSLGKLIQGKFVKSHPLQVKQLESSEGVKSCHIIFVGRIENKSLTEIMSKLRSEKIMSVGEGPDFIDLGGQIQFFVKENKVGFEVNLSAIEKAGLKIDARVLNIAKIRR